MTTVRTFGYLPEILNSFMGLSNESRHTTPAMNVIESADNYQIEIAVPGMTREDFSLKVDEKDNLIISLNKKSETEKHYLRRDFSYRQYEQTLILPDNVTKDRITAKAENGILYITLSKITEEEKIKNEINIAVA